MAWFLEYISGSESYDRDISQHSLPLSTEIKQNEKSKALNFACEKFSEITSMGNKEGNRNPELVWKETTSLQM